MNCKHPSKAFILGYDDDGKMRLKIAPYEVHHIEELSNGSYHKCYDEFVSRQAVQTYQNFIEIPCGKCIGCRLDYAKVWSERCLAEMKYHKNAYFLTLTYDDDHLPYNLLDTVGPDQAAALVNTLRAKDLQDFWKRLRKNTGQKIMYFACGEYGSKTWRPHYHAIVYDLKLDDLVLWSKNDYNQPLYRSERLEFCWHNGMVIVGEATKESIEYVARYTCKKAFDQMREIHIEENNMEPEFIRMSRRPAIGRQYYLDNYQYMNHFGHAYIGDVNGSNYISNNRYFKKLREWSDPDDMIQDRKKVFKKIEEINELRKSQTDKEYLEMLKDEEETLKKKLAWKRDL